MTTFREFGEKEEESLVFRAEYILAGISENIRKTIKTLREEAGLSQRDLAKLLGTQQSRISQMEDPAYGRYSLLILAKLADVLNCELHIELKKRTN